MSELVKFPKDIDVETHEIKGKHIYQTNDHFKRLANVMEHPEFREFYNMYMSDWDSAKTMIMFMKMYEALEKHAQITLTPYQKLAIVKDMIDDGKKREIICKGFSEWTNVPKELEN